VRGRRTGQTAPDGNQDRAAKMGDLRGIRHLTIFWAAKLQSACDADSPPWAALAEGAGGSCPPCPRPCPPDAPTGPSLLDAKDICPVAAPMPYALPHAVPTQQKSWCRPCNPRCVSIVAFRNDLSVDSDWQRNVDRDDELMSDSAVTVNGQLEPGESVVDLTDQPTDESVDPFSPEYDGNRSKKYGCSLLCRFFNKYEYIWNNIHYRYC